MPITTIIQKAPVIPVVTFSSPGQALGLVDALYSGGVCTLESMTMDSAIQHKLAS